MRSEPNNIETLQELRMLTPLAAAATPRAPKPFESEIHKDRNVVERLLQRP